MIKWLAANKLIVSTLFATIGITIWTFVDILVSVHTTDILIVLIAVIIIIWCAALFLCLYKFKFDCVNLKKNINDLVEEYIVIAEQQKLSGHDKHDFVIKQVLNSIKTKVDLDYVAKIINGKIETINLFADLKKCRCVNPCDCNKKSEKAKKEEAQTL